MKTFNAPSFISWFLTALIFISSARADKFQLLNTDRDAAQARMRLIEDAKEDVFFLYFIYYKDSTSLGGLAMLREAKRRGLRVRGIVDALFNKIPPGIIGHLADEGLELRVHNPFRPKYLLPFNWGRLLDLSKRMHDKGLIADMSRMVGGGRNAEGAYFGQDLKNYIDRDYFLESAEVKEFYGYLEALWKSDWVQMPDLSDVTAEQRRWAAKQLDQARDDLYTQGWWRSRKDFQFTTLETETPVQLVHALVDEDQRDVTAPARKLWELTHNIQEESLIESPYFVPTPRTYEVFEERLAAGKEITVLTNSVLSTDGLLPAAAYLRHRNRLAKMGVTIYEFNGPGTLHGKSAVFDRRVVGVGSFNLDPRSAGINSEILAYFEDSRIAAELIESIRAHITNSTLVAQGGKLLVPEKNPNLVGSKRFKVTCLKALMNIQAIENQT